MINGVKKIMLSFVVIVFLNCKGIINPQTILNNECDSIQLNTNGILPKVPIETQYIITKFYSANDQIISYFKEPIISDSIICNFQFGELAFFITQNASIMLNRRIIKKVVGKDTMFLEFHPPSGVHLYIDSIPFKKGSFIVDLGFSDELVLNESIPYSKWIKYKNTLSSVSAKDTILYYYEDFIGAVGVDFLTYFHENHEKVKLFDNYYYCQKIGDTTEERSAKFFIHDVLNEKYVLMKVKSIEPVDRIRGM